MARDEEEAGHLPVPPTHCVPTVADSARCPEAGEFAQLYPRESVESLGLSCKR